MKELCPNQGEPPPAAGEVAELVAALRRLAAQNPLGTADPTITRVAELLERQYPQPVPVSERPWEREGWCGEVATDEDIEGAFYSGKTAEDGWRCIYNLGREHGAQPAPLQPVPMLEHPWDRDGWCDEQGRCWIYINPDDGWHIPCWKLARPSEYDWKAVRRGELCFSLPANALPLPSAETPESKGSESSLSEFGPNDMPLG